jgi:hypothetical protein
MRKITFIIVLVSTFSVANCQTFKGTVYDRATDSTLSYAIIYISGTSIGTYSDVNGNFILDISKYSSMPITISMIGYYSATLSEHSSNHTYDIYLYPKVKELNEVVVSAKKGRWETYLRLFKREFLGETENAHDCDILNINDIRFSYKSDTLRAFALKPILIHNRALGYNITYYLDKFYYIRRIGKNESLIETFHLLGNYLFKDDLLTLNESEKKKVEKRRISTYLGSRMHFFRLLYLGNDKQAGEYNFWLSGNTIKSELFSIGAKTPINYGSVVISKDSTSGYLKNVGQIDVIFGIKYSFLHLRVDSAYFEKNGYYDPLEIVFSGDMARKRIGDLLPFEYLLK